VLGQKQTQRYQGAMSALPPESRQTGDIAERQLCAKSGLRSRRTKFAVFRVPLAVAVRASRELAAGARPSRAPTRAPKLEWV
jgi:hypothetical protein